MPSPEHPAKIHNECQAEVDKYGRAESEEGEINKE
jgi:hypothetical protein